MKLITFDYEGTGVRTLIKDDEFWFVLDDLCKVLGIKNVKDTKDRLDDWVVQTYPIQDSMGRTRNVTCVSKAGVYKVVIQMLVDDEWDLE